MRENLPQSGTGERADCAARMDKGVVGAPDFDQRYDLCAGEDVVWLRGHCYRERNRQMTVINTNPNRVLNRSKRR